MQRCKSNSIPAELDGIVKLYWFMRNLHEMQLLYDEINEAQLDLENVTIIVHFSCSIHVSKLPIFAD